MIAQFLITSVGLLFVALAIGALFLNVSNVVVISLLSCFWAMPFVRPPFGVTTYLGAPDIVALILLVKLLRVRDVTFFPKGHSVAALTWIFITSIWVSFLLGSLFHGHLEVVGFVTMKFTLWLLIFLLTMQIDWSPESVIRVTRIVFVCFLIPSFFALLEYFHIYSWSFYSIYPAYISPRVHSTVGLQSTNLGTMAMLMFLFGLWSMGNPVHGGLKITNVMLTLFYAFIMLIAQCRAATLTAVLVVPFFFLQKNKKRQFLIILSSGALFFLLFYFLTVRSPGFYDSVLARLFGPLSSEKRFLGSTGGRRVQMWIVDFHWLISNPLIFFFGTGVQSWRFEFPEGAGGHNLYLTTVGEVGIIGSIFYFGIFIAMLIKMWRTNLNSSVRNRDFRTLTTILLLSVFSVSFAQESFWLQFSTNTFLFFQLIFIALCYRAAVFNSGSIMECRKMPTHDSRES